EILADDVRRQYGTPPSGNANFAWMQHMLYHLSPKGIMGLVLSNGSLSSQSSGEGEIRQRIVDADLVDCIVALPKQLFYNTGIPACLRFFSRKKSGNGDRKREGEVLFIDASEMGFLADRVHRDFTEEDLKKITDTYHQRRKTDGKYEDQTGFCKSAKIDEIQKHSYVLTPGRYVGITEAEDDGIPFEEKMAGLTKTLAEQMAKEQEMNKNIKEQLKKIGFNL
ncbi:MAG: N-6 DNA methylase, partial [Candidatus Absconditabacterales bacterium]